MPWKNGELTRGEQAFAVAFAEVQDRVQAEQMAGVAPGYGYKLLLRPEVQAEIRAREEAKILTEGVPKAINALIEIVGSQKAPAASRVAAAKVLIDRGLPGVGESRVKEPHEMTAEELAQAIDACQAQAAALAKPVSVPNPYD